MEFPRPHKSVFKEKKFECREWEKFFENRGKGSRKHERTSKVWALFAATSGETDEFSVGVLRYGREGSARIGITEGLRNARGLLRIPFEFEG